MRTPVFFLFVFFFFLSIQMQMADGTACLTNVHLSIIIFKKNNRTKESQTAYCSLFLRQCSCDLTFYSSSHCVYEKQDFVEELAPAFVGPQPINVNSPTPPPLSLTVRSVTSYVHFDVTFLLSRCLVFCVKLVCRL